MGATLANNCSSTLANAVSSGATSIAINTGDGTFFPIITAGQWFNLTLTKLVGGVAQYEIVKVTARAGDVMTIVRGQEGTSALAFSAGDKVDLRLTAGTINSKMDKEGGTFSGPVDMADNPLKAAVMQDCAYAFKDAAAANTLDYRDGDMQRWAPTSGAQTLTITNWPAVGTRGELLIEGVNLGAGTITGPSVKWMKGDGTFNTTNSFNINHGAALQVSGIDFILLFTRDGGATIYGKVLR